jgi:acetyltransferase-like isoleucine patch superfamily enzyme/acyl carrier protein
MPPVRQRLARIGQRVWSRYELRGCDEVGADAEVAGHVKVINHGRIQIGKGLRLASQPVPSHFIADGGVIEIGDDVHIGHGSGITARGRVRIGSGSRLGAFVLAMDTDYHVAGDASAEADVVPLEIGSNVWIGNRVTILRGSVIGDGTRVLDGSVVRGSVPAGAIVEGVPARPIRASSASLESDSVEQRVLQAAQATFRLQQRPSIDDGPAQIEAWDSLGALSFVLALEEEFRIVISEERMTGISNLAEAVAVVLETDSI